MDKIIIFGATSAIIQAVLQQWSAQKPQLYLIGRNADKLKDVVADLSARGAEVKGHAAADLSGIGAHKELIDNALDALDGCTHAIIGHGLLPDQVQATANPDAMQEQFMVNAGSYFSILSILSETFKAQGHGHFTVISSVAGMRGRKSNYCYGAAKAALSCYLEGFTADMKQYGIDVLEVRPGFVDTPMTADLPKNGLYASPQKVAGDIIKAIDKKREVIFTPWFWQIIMGIIGILPRFIMRKLPI